MKSVEISEAGTKPLCPTSTTKPPLTTFVTGASITLPAWKSCSISSQTFLASKRRFDSK